MSAATAGARLEQDLRKGPGQAVVEVVEAPLVDEEVVQRAEAVAQLERVAGAALVEDVRDREAADAQRAHDLVVGGVAAEQIGILDAIGREHGCLHWSPSI